MWLTEVEMLEKEFKYYVDHQDELVKKYNGKCVRFIRKSL
jgi:hypothetical protein